MNTEAEFEAYLRESIPITEAMDFRVSRYGSEEVRVVASFEKNKSMKGTAFGGSIGAVGLAAAWGVAQKNVDEAALEGYLMIRQNSVKYLAPVREDFEARARLEKEIDWEKAKRIYDRMGVMRIEVVVTIFCDEEKVAVFKGEFAMVKEMA